jgi:hypothetical protein
MSSLKKLNPNAGMYVPPASLAAALPGQALHGPQATLSGSGGSLPQPAPSVADDQHVLLFAHSRSAFVEAVAMRSIPVPPATVDNIAFERFLFRSYLYAHQHEALTITCTSAPIGSIIPQIQPFWLRYQMPYWALAADVIAEVELQHHPQKPQSTSVEGGELGHFTYQQDRELLKAVYLSAVHNVPTASRRVLAQACADSISTNGSISSARIDCFVTHLISLVYIAVRGTVAQKVLGPLDVTGLVHYSSSMQFLGSIFEKIVSPASASGGIMAFAALALPMMLLSKADVPQLRMHAETAATLQNGGGKQLAAKLKFSMGLSSLIFDFLALPPNAPIEAVIAQLARSEMFADPPGLTTSLVSSVVNSWVTSLFNVLSSPEQHMPLVEPDLSTGSLLDLIANKTLLKQMPMPSVMFGPLMRASQGDPSGSQPAALSNFQPIQAQQPQAQQKQKPPVDTQSEFFTGTLQASAWFGEDNVVQYSLVAIATADAEPSLVCRILSAFRDAYVSIPSSFEALFSVMTEAAAAAAADEAAAEAAAAAANGNDCGGEAAGTEPRPTSCGIPGDIRSLLHVLSVSLRSGNAAHTRFIQAASQIAEQRLEMLLVNHAGEVDESAAASISSLKCSATGAAKSDATLQEGDHEDSKEEVLWSTGAAGAADSALGANPPGASIW